MEQTDEGSGAGISPEKENVVDPMDKSEENMQMVDSREEVVSNEKDGDAVGEDLGEKVIGGAIELGKEVDGMEKEQTNREEFGDEADGKGKEAVQKEKEVVVKKEEIEGEEDEDDDEEDRTALFDEPLIVEGKRRRSNIAHFAVTPTNRPRAVAYKGGCGAFLGAIDYVRDQIQNHMASELKSMYRVLFGRVGKTAIIKRDIRDFNGFEFNKTDPEYMKRLAIMRKMTLPEIRLVKQILGIQQSVDMGSNKDAMIDFVLTFLLQPVDHQRKIVRKEKKKVPKKEPKNATPTRKPRAKRAKKNDDDEESDKEDHENSDGSEEVEEDDEPPRKRPTKRKEQYKVAKEDKRADGDTTSRPTDSIQKKKALSKDEESPSPAQIEEACKQFIGSADLSTVTMKDMLHFVAEKFPDVDLPDRKAEIKAIIRRLIVS